MSDLVPFCFDDKLVRIADQDGSPWFVAKDVCDVLGLVNSRKAVAALDDDEKGVTISDTLGGPQEVSIVSESGLYALIFRSRKPAAKAFRKWVTAEVLPSIRQNGGYGQRLNEEVVRTIATDAGTMAAMETVRRMMALQRRGSKDLVVIDPRTTARFWQVVTVLEEMGCRINHARDAGLIALNLREVRQMALAAGVECPPLIALRRNLEVCRKPPLVAVCPVNSAVTGRTVRAWVFAKEV